MFSALALICQPRRSQDALSVIVFALRASGARRLQRLVLWPADGDVGLCVSAARSSRWPCQVGANWTQAAVIDTPHEPTLAGVPWASRQRAAQDAQVSITTRGMNAFATGATATSPGRVSTGLLPQMQRWVAPCMAHYRARRQRHMVTLTLCRVCSTLLNSSRIIAGSSLGHRGRDDERSARMGSGSDQAARVLLPVCASSVACFSRRPSCAPSRRSHLASSRNMVTRCVAWSVRGCPSERSPALASRPSSGLGNLFRSHRRSTSASARRGSNGRPRPRRRRSATSPGAAGGRNEARPALQQRRLGAPRGVPAGLWSSRLQLLVEHIPKLPKLRVPRAGLALRLAPRSRGLGASFASTFVNRGILLLLTRVIFGSDAVRPRSPILTTTVSSLRAVSLC